MPRGGRRAGAGRRTKLSVDQEIEIANLFEAVWANVIEAETQRVAEVTHPDLAAIRESHKALEAIPIPLRATRAGREQIEERVADVHDRLRQLAGMPPPADYEDANWQASLPRHFTFPTRVPPGARNALLSQVADFYSNEFGVPLTPKVVQKLVEEFRAINKRLREEDAV